LNFFNFQKGTAFIVVSLFLFFSLGLVSGQSAQPHSTSIFFESGYVIADNPQSILKQHQDYQANFFLYNISNGVLIDNSSVTCVLYVADSNGEVLFFDNVTYFPDGHWGIDISGNTFSNLGYHGYGIKCQSENLGGALSGLWEVIPTEGEQNTSFFLIFILISAGLLIVSILTKNHIFSTISGFSFVITGMYSMIFGFANYTNIYSQMISVILIGFGSIVMLVSAYESVSDD